MTEIDLPTRSLALRRFRAGIPLAESLQMTQYQPALRQVQWAITEHAGRALMPRFALTRQRCAKTRQTFCWQLYPA